MRQVRTVSVLTAKPEITGAIRSAAPRNWERNQANGLSLACLPWRCPKLAPDGCRLALCGLHQINGEHKVLCLHLIVACETGGGGLRFARPIGSERLIIPFAGRKFATPASTLFHHTYRFQVGLCKSSACVLHRSALGVARYIIEG